MKKNDLKLGFISNFLLFVFFIFFIGFCIFIINKPLLILPIISNIEIQTPPAKINNPLISQMPIKKSRLPRPTIKIIPTEEWGKAQKIGEHTYTIKLGHDDRMGTPQEIYEALNTYRSAHSRGFLAWDDKLASYAQERVNLFKSIKNTDEHAGLNGFLEHQDGFVKLGFNQIGENSYFGGPLYGVHIIEWLFASSVEHDANQLDPSWSHVGVGATNTSVNLVFGGGKM